MGSPASIARTAFQQLMRESGSAIVLKGPKQRIGVDLVARAIQKTAAIIATYIIAMRSDGASAVRDVGTRRPLSAWYFRSRVPR